MWFTQMNTLCCSFAEVSGYPQQYKGDYSSWPAGKPAAYTNGKAYFLLLNFKIQNLKAMILKLIWALKSLTFPLKSLVCWLFSLLNNPLPGDRPALCQIFFLLCDFSQDLLSFKTGKTEKNEIELKASWL